MRLRAKHKKISRATIYRTLELLVESGIVGKLRIGEAGYRYERLRAGEHHDHLICNQCGRVIEFFEPRSRSSRTRSASDTVSCSLSHSHQLRGICRQCRPRAKASARQEIRRAASRCLFRQATRMNRRPRRSTASPDAASGSSGSLTSRGSSAPPPKSRSAPSAILRRASRIDEASPARRALARVRHRRRERLRFEVFRDLAPRKRSPKIFPGALGRRVAMELRDDRLRERDLGVPRVLRLPRHAAVARRCPPSGRRSGARTSSTAARRGST